jgi:hypothetical protein
LFLCSSYALEYEGLFRIYGHFTNTIDESEEVIYRDNQWIEGSVGTPFNIGIIVHLLLATSPVSSRHFAMDS